MKKIITIIAVIALVAVLGVVLFACAPSSVEKATSKMTKAGYTVSSYSTKDAEDSDGGITAVKANSLLDWDGIYAMHFTSTKAAKKFYEDLIGSDKEDQKEAKENNLKQDGKWVYWGSDAAVKAFTK